MTINQKKKIVIGVTGASGAIYAKKLMERLYMLNDQIASCGVVFSKAAREVWSYELQGEDFSNIPFKIFEPDNFFAPFASGSAGYDTMIICPCSMGCLGRIANGISGDLISRAADVILKERGKLVLVSRESPLNLIHIRNMEIITQAGGIILPASPSFYASVQTLDDAINTVVERILMVAGFQTKHFHWGEQEGYDFA